MGGVGNSATTVPRKQKILDKQRSPGIMGGTWQPPPTQGDDDVLPVWIYVEGLMNDLPTVLRELQRTLNDVAQDVAMLRQDRVSKEAYSIKEAAAMTERQGCRSYSEWYLREACRKGLIVGAYKPHSQQGWRIPHDTLRRILVDGMPVEKA